MIEYVFKMNGIKDNNLVRVKNFINTVTGIELTELNKCEIKEVKNV